MPKKRPPGRPSTFRQETADAICQKLVAGESLRAICREEGMPPASTVALWLGKHKDFAEQYAQARDVALDLMADEVLEIADGKSGDVQRDRLKFDARRWYLSKLAPKRYGDRLSTEITGKDGAPLALTLEQLVAQIPVIKPGEKSA